MQRTDNFNLIVVEGSDTVNLLTQMNPNTEAIDGQMFKNQNAGVQTATELLSGTVHAITRSVPDASMIRFTAVSRFTAGDTFTVDGVQVSALLPSGEQLPDGAFIIGSEVLCVLKGTLLTVFASGSTVALAKNAEKLGGNLPSYYATKTEVDNAQSTANSAGNLAEQNSGEILRLKNDVSKKVNIEDVTFSLTPSGDVNSLKGFKIGNVIIVCGTIKNGTAVSSGYKTIVNVDESLLNANSIVGGLSYGYNNHSDTIFGRILPTAKTIQIFSSTSKTLKSSISFTAIWFNE